MEHSIPCRPGWVRRYSPMEPLVLASLVVRVTKLGIPFRVVKVVDERESYTEPKTKHSVTFYSIEVEAGNLQLLKEADSGHIERTMNSQADAQTIYHKGERAAVDVSNSPKMMMQAQRYVRVPRQLAERVLRDIKSNIVDCGGCDHSVGICFCHYIRTVSLLEPILKAPQVKSARVLP